MRFKTLVLLMLFSFAAMAGEVKSSVVYGLITAALENDTNYLQQHFEEVYADFGKGEVAEHKLLDNYLAFANAHPDLAEALDAWVDEYPESGHAYITRGVYHHAVALQYRGQNDDGSPKSDVNVTENLEKAVKDIIVATGLYEDYALPYGFLISVHATSGSRAAMQQAMRKGLEIDPASYTVRSSYLDALHPEQGGNFSDMSSFITKGLAYEKSNPDLKMLRGYLHAAAAKLQGEANKSEEVVSLSSQAEKLGLSAQGLHMVGVAYFHAGEFDSAWNALEKSRRNSPGLMANYFWKGRLLASQKKYDDAIYWYDQALALNPVDTKVLLWKSKVLVALQEFEGAASAYQTILSFCGAGNQKISVGYEILLSHSRTASLD